MERVRKVDTILDQVYFMSYKRFLGVGAKRETFLDLNFFMDPL